MACVGLERVQGVKPIQQCTRENEPTFQDAGLASTTCYGQRKQSHVRSAVTHNTRNRRMIRVGWSEHGILAFGVMTRFF